MDCIEEPFLPADLCDDLCCCVICFEPFSDKRTPKALPCLHTFCRICLSNSISAHKKAISQRGRSRSSDSKNFSCPVCKEVTRIPDKGIDGFRDDFRIRKISEVLAKTRELSKQHSFAELSDNSKEDAESEKDNKTEKESKEDTRMSCDVCKFFDKESDAPLYCLECTKLLCRECAEDHINATITKDHDIINASEKLPTESVCKIHPTEILKYFCHTCKEAVCMACTYTDDHKDHEIIKLSEHTSDIKQTLEELLCKCKDRMPEIHSNMNQLDTLEQALNSKEKSAQKAILQRTLEEISKVRSHQNKMEQELDSICRKKYKELQVKKTEISEIKDILDMTDLLVNRGQDLQLVCIQDEVKENLQKILGAKEFINVSEISFTDLGKYEGLVEDVESHTKDEGSTRSAILADIKSVVSQMRMFSVGRSDTKPELVKKTGKKGSAEGEFNFPSGVVVLSNGDIAIADLHNHRVQIFTPDGIFKHMFGSGNFKPCGLAVMKDGNLAVTDCSITANCIKIFTSEGVMKKSLGEGQFDYPFSIAISSKNRYVVSDPAINKITVINQDGSLHRRFGTRSKFCFYLTMNNRDEIIVSDWYNHCIKIFASNGQLLRKVGTRGTDDGQMLIPLGIVTDRRGNILILDCKCGRLSMFSQDGRFIKQLIGQDEGIEFSRALALSPDGRLVITTGDNKREVPNELYIYQI